MHFTAFRCKWKFCWTWVNALGRSRAKWYGVVTSRRHWPLVCGTDWLWCRKICKCCCEWVDFFNITSVYTWKFVSYVNFLSWDNCKGGNFVVKIVLCSPKLSKKSITIHLSGQQHCSYFIAMSTATLLIEQSLSLSRSELIEAVKSRSSEIMTEVCLYTLWGRLKHTIHLCFSLYYCSYQQYHIERESALSSILMQWNFCIFDTTRTLNVVYQIHTLYIFPLKIFHGYSLPT